MNPTPQCFVCGYDRETMPAPAGVLWGKFVWVCKFHEQEFKPRVEQRGLFEVMQVELKEQSNGPRDPGGAEGQS